MRCPKCGFISFDDLVACAKCNLKLEGKNAVPFEGTAIRAQHAISLRATETRSEEPELMVADEQDAADDLYKELAAESVEAGLTGESADGGEEFDLSLAEPEESEEGSDFATGAQDAAGEEIPVLETEEEIPAIDLSGFGAEADEEAGGADEPESDVADAETGPGSQAVEIEFDLAADEEDEESEPTTEESGLASAGTAANLEGIDLSGLMGGEDEGPAADSADMNGADGIYDLSDLMTAEGDADDVLALDADDDEDGEPTVDEESMLDLTSDEEEEETAADSLKLDQDNEESGGEELELHLELEEEGDEEPAADPKSDEEPAADPKAEISLSGLSLENEEDA